MDPVSTSSVSASKAGRRRTDPISTTSPVSVPATTPPFPVSIPEGRRNTFLQPRSGAEWDVRQQNQNSGIQRPIRRRRVLPTQQPYQGDQSDVPGVCCCDLGIGLILMASFDICIQVAVLFVLSMNMSKSGLVFGIRNCTNTSAFKCDMFYVAEIFLLALAAVDSMFLVLSTCMMKKWLSVTFYVVGWIPVLAAFIYASVYFQHYTNIRGDYRTKFLISGVIIGLFWRIYEGFLVYSYWIKISDVYYVRKLSRNQADRNIFGGHEFGRTNYGAGAYGGYAAPPTFGIAQPGYGNYLAYGQPGGYSGYDQHGYLAGYDGYGGFGQPAVGGSGNLV